MRGAAILLAISTWACAPTPPLSVKATGQGETCSVQLDGVEMPFDAADQAKFRALAKAHGRRVVVAAEPQTPYRCIGGIIFSLQRAGFRVGSFVGNDVPASEQ